jgi:hypothetical protein
MLGPPTTPFWKVRALLISISLRRVDVRKGSRADSLRRYQMLDFIKE